MRKQFKLGAIAAVAALALAGCSSGGDKSTSDSESGATDDVTQSEASEAIDGSGATITVWSDENRKAAIDLAAKTFEADTGAKVNVVQKNFDDLRTDFIAQVPSGKGPDITVGAHDWLGALVSEGVVNTIDLGATADEFEKVTIDAFTYEGQLYGLPYSSEAVALVENADLGDGEGADTYDELIQKGEATGAERPLLVEVGSGGNMYTAYAFQTSFDAPVFVQDSSGSYTTEVGMGGENGDKFAQWISDQAAAKILSSTIGGDEANDLFKSKKSPYIVTGPWAIDDYKKAGLDNLKVHKIPSAGGSTASPFVGVQGFYLSSQSENALLATNFIVNYLGSEDIQRAFYEADPRIPAMTSLAEQYKDDPIIGGFIESAAVGVPMPSIPEMGDVWEYWNTAEVEIVKGADPTSTWERMVSQVEDKIK